MQIAHLQPFLSQSPYSNPLWQMPNWVSVALSSGVIIAGTVVGLVIVVGLLSSWVKLKPTTHSRRHQRNIQQGRQTLDRLGAIAEPGRTPKIIAYLRKIDPYVFEELLLESFERMGYRIVRNKRYSGDGGLDGRIYDSYGRTFLVQAKRYKGFIRTEHVSDFITLIGEQGAQGGYFIHTGTTPINGFALAETGGIRILSGKRLVEQLLCPQPPSASTIPTQAKAGQKN